MHARASGASLVSPDAAPRVGQVRVQAHGTTESFWEYLGAAPARGIVNYALTVPTLADSTPDDKALANYVVDVHVTPLNYVFASDPASGYSVDNIAPASPTSLTGTYLAGSGSDLSWSMNSEPDLAGYRLYRSATPGFTPSPITLVYEGVDHQFHDVSGPAYYKVGAIDVHGNEGGYASALSGGPVGVDEQGTPKVLAFAFASANPGRGGAALRLELPHASHVRLSVFDAQGRSVRRLVDGSRPAGVHALRWDGRGEAGQQLGAGLYFIRVESEGRRIERRFAMLR
jgi:hypothetical protein